MRNLLSDHVIRVRLDGGERKTVSLSETLALLTLDRIEAFVGLMPHQRHAWHAFLVQLAAIGLNEGGKSTPPASADGWRALLRELTKSFKADEPWCLVVEDVGKPAFMQPPVPEGSLVKAGFKERSPFPDDLGILVTTKSFDIKTRRVKAPSPDHWVYALVTLQTFQGFSGRDNYGIARMNGGFASRPAVGLVPPGKIGARFRRDLWVLLDARAELLHRKEFAGKYLNTGGCALLWVEPWNGKTSLPFKGLDPFFIEVCRRVRLTEEEGRIIAWKRSTAVARLGAKDLKGNTGDPWAPLNKKAATALTVSRNGFTYKKFQAVVLGSDYERAFCQLPHREDAASGLHIEAQAMTRGQGKTEGFHERRLPVPPNIQKMYLKRAQLDRLGRISQQRVNDAGELQKRVLRPALLAFVQGGPDQIKFKDVQAGKWVDQCVKDFDRKVDEVFFADLWNSAEMSDEDARQLWVKKMADIGRTSLREAERVLPVPTGRRYRAIATAEGRFEGALRKIFPIMQRAKGVE